MSVASDHGSAAKIYRRGTHRTTAPDATIAGLRPLMAAFGITRVANLTGLDRTGIPVVMVCRPNARSSAVFHGKGIDIAAAKASGLMEAIETWHAEHLQVPLRFGSYNELHAGHRLIDVSGLPRAPGNRFHPDLRTLWVEGHDLIARERVWLPFETVHADFTLFDAPGSGCFAAGTNGLASGNHFLEAVSHALCEIIERDSTSLWRCRQRVMQDETRLDLATVDDEKCRDLLDRLDRADLDVAVWETTVDVGVTAFQCLVLDRNGELGHVGQGAGCHPARDIALLRAVTEAAQVRTTYIVGSREDIEYDDYRPSTLAARYRSVRALMQPVARMRDFASVGHFEFDTFEVEVAWLADRLKAAGISQAAAVDLTRSEFGIPVVRVVIPGLEGSDHHASYVPGKRARAIAGSRA